MARSDPLHLRIVAFSTFLFRNILEGSLMEVPLRRVPRRRLVRVSVGAGVLRRVLRRGGVIEGA